MTKPRPASSSAPIFAARPLALFVALLVAAACGENSVGTADAGDSDAGGSDAGTDAGARTDAGPDAGTADAGSDAGTADAGSDAGTADAGSDAGSDAGVGDAGVIDAGTDAGALDAGEDAGSADGGDAGNADAGSDAGVADAGEDGGSDGGVAMIPERCNGSAATAYTPQATLPATPGITVPSGFTVEAIASIGSARELAALPNGDLLVATDGTLVMLIPNAESDGNPGAPVTFTTINDSPSQGITYDPTTCTIYAATHGGIYSIAYTDAMTSGSAGSAIASVRTGIIAPHSDGDVHVTTSVSVADGTLYAGVGSSCNACVEVDPTRAVVMQFGLDGSSPLTKATRVRNAIALATNPATGTLWAGGAGQDNLPVGHPYEYFDAVTLHTGIADYGWPACEENQHAYIADAGCSETVEPLVELPAYSTIIGAVFYPVDQAGAYAFPEVNRGLYLSGHGSWHATNNVFDTPPRVAFVPITGDVPATPVNWSDPSVQWSEFVGGFDTSDGKTHIARPTGIAVGSRGSLFLADDWNGLVYRIRHQ